MYKLVNKVSDKAENIVQYKNQRNSTMLLTPKLPNSNTRHTLCSAIQIFIAYFFTYVNQYLVKFGYIFSVGLIEDI